MEAIEYWKLPNSLTVIQAALLIVGKDPDLFQGNIFEDPPSGFGAVFAALKNDIKDGKLKALIRLDSRTEHCGEYRNYSNSDEIARPWPLSEDMYEDYDIFYKAEPNWEETTVSRQDLVEWLFNRNYKPPLFFEQQTTTDSLDSLPGYLDKNHPCYSPKLAAAVRAWEAVTTDQKYRNNGKTVKANLARWLNDHAAEFGLVKEDGTPNSDAINNQIAKVANWQTDGGAPKTPGG
ncbi:MAG: hypothetical protein RBR16_06645 [Syntrophus sp. (in: bacteria)]|nr:hypothetical protein [Syntrophus sp. (in: bacteria)]